ncbi:MAG: ABC transporter substrate-binding protein [SAR324 cluster bacterium]|nr:ABC transporter substrate-binding protein [SAR324 cluster bacterium]
MSMKVKMILSMLMLLLCSPMVYADEADAVTNVTREKINMVIGFLRDKTLTKADRNQKILGTIDTIFDFQTMAMLSLGKKHWSGLSETQRQEFTNLFVKRLQDSYLEKLDLYTDEDVVVENANQVKKNRIEVKTLLVSKDDKKEMIYKFFETDKSWQIYDVEVMGVSIVQTYRSQFEGVLKQETMDDLIGRMKTSADLAVPEEGK